MTKNTKILLGVAAAYLVWVNRGKLPLGFLLSSSPATVPTGTAPAAANKDALAPVLQSIMVVGKSFFDPPPVAGGAPVVPIPGFVP